MSAPIGRARVWLTVTMVALAALGFAVVTDPSLARQEVAGMPAPWATLLGAGDARLAGRISAALPAPGLSARAAYLLAFHAAQDAGDVPGMLAAAERLERLGEPALAAYLRRAAGENAAERLSR
ncbi:MAG TPA: hypothetical protein VGW35_27065 [Methylomirabilota bacterium]|jgi:hypothetical protein|nr:hypothetical protein [Methylomirabilota bacterium]